MPLIRVASELDAAMIADVYAPAVLHHPTSFELVPPDAAEFSTRISTVLKKYPWLVCETNGEVLGYAYASAHRDRAAYRWSVDVAAYVSASAHRRGIGTALYTSLFEILALQGLRNAYAGITLPNPGSEGLHRAFGFALVGVYRHVGYKMGSWHDVAWFERPISDAVIDPSEPVSFPEIRDGSEVAAAFGKGQALLG